MGRFGGTPRLAPLGMMQGTRKGLELPPDGRRGISAEMLGHRINRRDKFGEAPMRVIQHGPVAGRFRRAPSVEPATQGGLFCGIERGQQPRRGALAGPEGAGHDRFAAPRVGITAGAQQRDQRAFFADLHTWASVAIGDPA